MDSSNYMKSIDSLNIAITGARGYVGSAISKYFQAHNTYDNDKYLKIEVLELSRPRFSLADTTDYSFLENIDVLVHCAYDFDQICWEDIVKINVEGSIRLLQAAHQKGIKIIFISTLSAFPGCVSKYGKAKLLIEEAALPLGAMIIRPGLVYDEKPRGMVGAMLAIAKISPLLPLLNGGQQMLYFCHVEDLAAMAYAFSTRELNKRISNRKESSTKEDMPLAPPVALSVALYYTAASEQGLSFREFFNKLAALKEKKVLFLPLPSIIPLSMLKLIESLGFKFRIKSDSLISFMNLNPSVDFSSTRKTGCAFRELDLKTLRKA